MRTTRKSAHYMPQKLRFRTKQAICHVLLTLLVAQLVFAAGCGAAVPAVNDPSAPAADSSPPSGFVQAVNDYSYRSASVVLSSAEAKDNSLFSPISFWYAFAVCAPATAGETQREILDALGATDLAEIEAEGKKLLDDLSFTDGDYSLELANSVWLDSFFNYRQEYIDEVKDSLSVEDFHINMADPGQAKQQGEWVAEKTKGTLSPDFEANGSIELRILNTVYFKDRWVFPFDEKRTYEDTFYAPAKDVTADFMHANLEGSYAYGEGYTRARLDFENGCYMVFVLPNEGSSPQEFISKEKALSAAFTGAETSEGLVSWSLPKYKLDKTTDLLGMLTPLGIVKATGKEADFSGLSDTPGLFISSVSQGIHLEVSEVEVEASAYTEAAVATGSTAPPRDIVDMNLNRPFLYAIYSSGDVPLFIGICNDPAAG